MVIFVKEAFLKAADSLFENFSNETQTVKAIKMCNSPTILLQDNVRERLWRSN